MSFRVAVACLIGLCAVAIPRGVAASSSSSIGAAAIQEMERPRPAAAAPRIYGQRKIIEFFDPPISLEPPAPEPPPPAVTLRSDPVLRAMYPPNPFAETISESFREAFGHLVEYNFTLSGPDEDLLVRRATGESLLSVAARVYYFDRILLSQDILPRYLEQQSDRYLRRIGITNRRIVGGQPTFDLRLIIDQDVLLHDLEEKRFIYRPKIRPFFYVFLDQSINGQPDREQGLGRRAIEDVLRDRNVRYADHGVPSMENPDVDLTASAELLNEGRQAAQRNEIEVVITGSMVTRMTDLEAPVNEEDWASDTVSVTMKADPLQKMTVARLPLPLLTSRLREVHQERRDAGVREWWDVGSVEVDVPLEMMDLSDADRAALGSSSPPRAIVSTGRIGYKRNFYSPGFYASTRLDLTLMRVDNGEVLARAWEEVTASHEEVDRAIQLSISRAVNNTANRLVDEFNRVWDKTVLDRADFKIIASRVSEHEIASLAEAIREIDANAEVNVRSHLSDVAVLTVVFPPGRAALLKAITRMSHPRFRLVEESRNALEIEQL